MQITNHFNDEPRLNGVFLEKNLPRIKYETYVITLNDTNSKGKHWVSLFINKNSAKYFHFFGIEYISQEVFKKSKGKSITQNIFRLY